MFGKIKPNTKVQILDTGPQGHLSFPFPLLTLNVTVQHVQKSSCARALGTLCGPFGTTKPLNTRLLYLR